MDRRLPGPPCRAVMRVERSKRDQTTVSGRPLYTLAYLRPSLLERALGLDVLLCCCCCCRCRHLAQFYINICCLLMYIYAVREGLWRAYMYV
jgi:hypothetical protein